MKNSFIQKTFEIRGFNLDYLVTELKRKNVDVYKIRKKSSKKLILVTVDYKDCEKLFAICHNMCYNISERGVCGKLAFAYKLLNNIGVLIGMIAFCLLCYFNDGIMYSTVYMGDSAYFRKDLEAILEAEGVRKGVNFTNLDFQKLQKEILLCNREISFASVKKRGNKLIIDVIRTKKESERIAYSSTDFTSSVEGIVTDITVLSGTLLVKIGDKVKTGDVIVGAYYINGESRIIAPVIAEVSIKAEYVYRYESSGEGELYENRAFTLAMENLGDKTVFSHSETTEKEEKKIIIYSRIFYEEILRAGE